MDKQVARNIRKALRAGVTDDPRCPTLVIESHGGPIRADAVGLALLGSLDMDLEKALKLVNAMNEELSDGTVDDGPASQALFTQAHLTSYEAVAIKKVNFNGASAPDIATQISRGKFIVEPS